MRNPVREVIGDAVVICEAFPRRRGWEVLCSFTRPGRQPVIASHGTWASKDAAFHTMSEVLDSIREKWAKVANPNIHVLSSCKPGEHNWKSVGKSGKKWECTRCGRSTTIKQKITNQNPNGFWPDPTYDPDDEDSDERARVRRRLRVSKMGARRNVIVDTRQIGAALSKLNNIRLGTRKPTDEQLIRWARIEQAYGSQFKVSDAERKRVWLERGHII